MIDPQEVKIENMALEMSPMAETLEQVKATEGPSCRVFDPLPHDQGAEGCPSYRGEKVNPFWWQRPSPSPPMS